MGCCCGSVLAFAFAPLVIDATGASDGPFAYNTAVIAFQTAVLAGFLDLSAPKVFAARSRGPIAGLDLEGRRGAVALLVAALVLSRAEYAFFAWSAAHIDAAATAALFRLWPLLMVAALAFYGRRLRARMGGGAASGYRLRFPQAALMGAAAVGAVLVVAGESGSVGDLFSDGDLATGVGLAAAGAVCAAISPACSLILGDVLHRAARPAGGLPAGGAPRAANAERMWYAVLAHTVSGALYLPSGALASAGIARLAAEALAGAALVGAVCSGIGILLLRAANTLTSDLSVNALFHAMPPLSLLLLVAVAGVDIARPGLFAAGTALVLGAAGAAEASGRTGTSR